MPLERVVGYGDVGAITGVYTGKKSRLGPCGGAGITRRRH